MEKIFLLVLSFFLISCENNNDNEKTDIMGKWTFISKESFSANVTDIYPNSLSSKIEIEFNEDSVVLFGCNTQLGIGTYILKEDGGMFISGIPYIEPCSLDGWIETVATCLSHSVSAVLNNDTLKIMSDNINGIIFLNFSRN